MSSLKERMAVKKKAPPNSLPQVSDHFVAPDLPSATNPGMSQTQIETEELPPVPPPLFESLPSLPPLPLPPTDMTPAAAHATAAINVSNSIKVPFVPPSQFSDQDPSLPPTPASAPVKPALPEAGLDSPTPSASNSQTRTSSSDQELQKSMTERLNLQSERTALQAQLKIAQQQLAQAANENEAIREASKQQIKALEAEKAAMTADLSSSKQLLGAAKSGDESLQAALESAKQQIKALEAEKAAMTADISSSKQLLGAAKSGDESLQAALESAKQQIKALEAEKAAMTADISSSKQLLGAAKSGDESLQAALESAKQQIKALEAEKAAMTADLSSSKQLLGAAKSGDESLQAALESAKQQIKALEAEKAAMTADLSSSKQLLGAAKSGDESLQAALESAKQQIKALEAEKAAMTADLSSSKQLLGAAKSGDESLQAALESAKQQIKALEAEKAALTADLSSSKQLLGAAKSGDESLQAALESAKQQIKALESQRTIRMSDAVAAVNDTATSHPVISCDTSSNSDHLFENPQSASRIPNFHLHTTQIEFQHSPTGCEAQRARTPTKTNNFREMKHETSDRQYDIGLSQQSLSSVNLRMLPSTTAAAISSRTASTSVSSSQKDAVQRHLNPSTSHVSTSYNVFTPQKASFKDFKEVDIERDKSGNLEATIVSPNILMEQIPNSIGLFDRMKLQARLHLESKDTEIADFPPTRSTHTPSRLSTFMDTNRGFVPGERLQESFSTLVERKMAVLGDFKHSDTERLVELRTKASGEMDPIQASELWQKARAEQRLLRSSQVSGNFEERWSNINAIRDSMFKSGPPELTKSDPQRLNTNPVLSRSKDLSFRSSIGIPRTKLEHRVSDHSFDDSAMNVSDLRPHFPSAAYDRL
jgi:hypothetical protein